MVKTKPLEGIKILELGKILLPHPFAGKIFAEFGAEVIKVEEPTKGDPLRNWRVMYEDTSIWWHVQSRNKKSITVNLRDERGQKIIKKLVQKVDVVLEKFQTWNIRKMGIRVKRFTSH